MTTTTTQTDRELLELAAKAAGAIKYEYTPMPEVGDYGFYADFGKGMVKWYPRHNDGASFRLAVKLRFTVAVRPHEVEVFSDEGECLASVPIFTASTFVKSEDATKPTDAVRLAIVRAAAEIGRAMP